jgi:hypothetical protein
MRGRRLPIVAVVAILVMQTAWARAEEQPFRAMCALWNAHASDVIARRVEESKHEADLRGVSDAILRMRRARRNCENGWIMSACIDYHAIIHRLPGTTVVWTGETACPSVLIEELRIRMREAQVARD